MAQANQEHALRPQNDATTIAGDDAQSGSGFQLSADDPRSVENRGGLEAVIERTTEKLDYEPSAQDLGPAADGTTGGAFDADYVGAGTTGSTTSTVGSGIPQLNTTGNFGSTSQVPGVGPTESVIGTQAPALGSSNDDIQTDGARVEDADGQPL